MYAGQIKSVLLVSLSTYMNFLISIKAYSLFHCHSSSLGLHLEHHREHPLNYVSIRLSGSNKSKEDTKEQHALKEYSNCIKVA